MLESSNLAPIQALCNLLDATSGGAYKHSLEDVAALFEKGERIERVVVANTFPYALLVGTTRQVMSLLPVLASVTVLWQGPYAAIQYIDCYKRHWWHSFRTIRFNLTARTSDGRLFDTHEAFSDVGREKAEDFVQFVQKKQREL